MKIILEGFGLLPGDGLADIRFLFLLLTFLLLFQLLAPKTETGLLVTHRKTGGTHGRETLHELLLHGSNSRSDAYQGHDTKGNDGHS